MRLISSAKTDKGMQRANNEDSVQLWGQEQAVLAIVADGMGGAAAGEEASRIAVDTIQTQLMSAPFKYPTDYSRFSENDLLDRMLESVRHANLNIIARAIAMPEYKGMGTTLTMAFARDADVLLAHVGDSRAYLVDGYDHSITQLTADHSFVQALVDAGHITQEESENHPMKNVLYRALGQNSEVDVDLISGVIMNAGDRIIMCSDGLTLHVKTPEIARIALADDDPTMIATHLIALANERGGRDNVSVIVILAQSEGILDEPTPRLAWEDDDPTLPLL